MTDRPIIFSAPMVRALLDGRKTQTRRVLKIVDERGNPDFRTPYAPGDRLWVREKHWCVELEGGGIGAPYLVYDEEWSTGPGARMPEPTEERPFWGPPYWDDGREERWGARPSIHMPRWASRLTLIVTDARVQRVQEISREDAIAEGIMPSDAGGVACWRGFAGAPVTPCAGVAFSDLWKSIHGADAWDRNEWIVALTFTVHHQNIDQMERETAAA